MGGHGLALEEVLPAGTRGAPDGAVHRRTQVGPASPGRGREGGREAGREGGSGGGWEGVCVRAGGWVGRRVAEGRGERWAARVQRE